MSEPAETPIINDAITSDDAGFSSDAGDQVLGEAPVTEEVAEEVVEASEGESESSDESGGVQAETTEELKAEIEEAIEDGATQEEVQAMIEEFTLKVNGKEKKVTVDWNDKEDIKRRLQLAEVSHMSMQEKRELEKSYEAEVRKLMENPKEYLKEIGLDPLELGEGWLREEVEERKKSPELRAQEKLEKELAEAREALKKQQEEAENARMSQLEAEEASKLEAEIDAALDAHPKLPRSQKTVTRIADHLLWAIENADTLGLDPNDISVEDVIPSVEREIREELREFMSQLPEDMMEEYIGQQNLERLRKKRLSNIKPNNISNVKPTTESVKPKEEKTEKKRQKAKDYFRNL